MAEHDLGTADVQRVPRIEAQPGRIRRTEHGARARNAKMIGPKHRFKGDTRDSDF